MKYYYYMIGLLFSRSMVVYNVVKIVVDQVMKKYIIS